MIENEPDDRYQVQNYEGEYDVSHKCSKGSGVLQSLVQESEWLRYTARYRLPDPSYSWEARANPASRDIDKNAAKNHGNPAPQERCMKKAWLCAGKFVL